MTELLAWFADRVLATLGSPPDADWEAVQ